MQNVTATAASTSPAAENSNSGGVAVLAAPAPTQPVKRNRRHTKKAEGTIAPASERAAVITEGQGDTAVAAAQIAVLDQVEASGVNLRSPEVPAAQRTITQQAALTVCEGVGLGNKSGGYGPLTRSTMIAMVKVHLNKKVAKREDITADNLEAILTDKDFQAKANVALTKHLEGLKSDVTADTVVARTKNAALAKKWIDTGMHASYLAAIRALKDLGGQAHFGKISMPLNRALGVAFGRNITAAELVHELNVANKATPAAA
jgi:hypothetical protein